MIMKKMDAGRKYRIYIDAAYVMNGLRANTAHYINGSNGDISRRIFIELDRIGEMETVKVKSHVDSDEQWEKYGMTAEARCYNAGADAAASGTANNIARSINERSEDGGHWYDTYNVAIRIATIEASIRKATEKVHHLGKNFEKLEQSRETAIKGS